MNLLPISGMRLFIFYVIGLFHLAYCLQGSTILQHVPWLPSFLRLNYISLYVHTIFCLSIYPLMDTMMASTFWLLWVMLLWTRVYKYLFTFLLSLLLGVHPEVKLLGQMVSVLHHCLRNHCFHSFLMHSCGEMYPYISQTQSPPRNKNRSIPEVELHLQVERAGIIPSLPLASLPPDPHHAHK